MAKFYVNVQFTCYHMMAVDATDADEACEIARSGAVREFLDDPSVSEVLPISVENERQEEVWHI